MVDRVDERVCPICDQQTSDTLCPKHGVQTVTRRALEVTSGELSSGSTIADRYRIEYRIGKGAMGTVYAARQIVMNRRVALKVLSPSALSDRKELRRFHREALNASSLEHPNVVSVYEFDVDAQTGLPYLAMELVEGRTLRRLLYDEGPMEPIRAARILEQVGRALVAAHQVGIVHRDLKPDNIMVKELGGDDEHVTVLDFGIAKSVRIPEDREDQTGSGMAVGTPRYMSPEQVLGEPVDPRADLYALGCVLHEVLTGRPPFEGDDPVALMYAHVNAARPPLPDLRIDSASMAAYRILHTMLLATKKEERPVGAAPVARVLRKLAHGRPHPDVLGVLIGADGAPPDAFRPSGEMTPDIDRPAHWDSKTERRRTLEVDSSDISVDEPSAPELAEKAEARSDRRFLDGMRLLLSLGLGIIIGASLWIGRERSPEPVSDSARQPERRAFVPGPRATSAQAVGPAPGASVRERVRIEIDGTYGARVLDHQGRLRGRIPLTIEEPRRDRRLRWTASAEGFLEVEFWVKPDHDQQLVVRLPRAATR